MCAIACVVCVNCDKYKAARIIRGAPRGEFVRVTCRSSQSSFYLGEIFSDTAARSCSATHSSLGQLPEKMRTDDER